MTMADNNDDDLYDTVAAMAKRLGLKGDERTQYIHEHMTRSGYKAIPNYVKADKDDDNDNRSPFFGSSSSGRSRGSGSRSRRRDDDDDW